MHKRNTFCFHCGLDCSIANEQFLPHMYSLAVYSDACCRRENKSLALCICVILAYFHTNELPIHTVLYKYMSISNIYLSRNEITRICLHDIIESKQIVRHRHTQYT